MAEPTLTGTRNAPSLPFSHKLVISFFVLRFRSLPPPRSFRSFISLIALSLVVVSGLNLRKGRAIDDDNVRCVLDYYYFI
jgi:hypothetical protein